MNNEAIIQPLNDRVLVKKRRTYERYKPSYIFRRPIRRRIRKKIGRTILPMLPILKFDVLSTKKLIVSIWHISDLATGKLFLDFPENEFRANEFRARFFPGFENEFRARRFRTNEFRAEFLSFGLTVSGCG